MGNVDLVTSGSFTRAANGFVWNDTEYIDDYRRRINADLLGGNVYFSLTAPTGSGSLGINGSAGYKNVGAPGPIDPSLVSTAARQKTMTAQGQVLFDTDRFLTDVLSLNINGFYKYYGIDFEDPDYDPSSTKLHTTGLDLTQEFIALDMLSLIYGGNITYEYAISTEIDEHKRINGAAFLELAFYPVSNVSIIPALRYDYYSDYPGSLNYKLNVVYSLNNSTSLKLSGGKSYRIPTLNDLYWPDDPVWFMRGNTNLTPETGYYGEIGFSMLTDRIQVNAFVFTRYLIDAIIWGFNTVTLYYEPLNIGESLFPGVELDAEINFYNNLWLTGDYTFIYSYLFEGFSSTYKFSDDKRAPYVPVHSVDAALEYRGSKTTGGIYFEYVDKTYKDDDNTVQINAYHVFNIHLHHQLNDYLVLSLAANNILNNIYKVIYDYIAPPVSFWLGAELTL